VTQRRIITNQVLVIVEGETIVILENSQLRLKNCQIQFGSRELIFKISQLS